MSSETLKVNTEDLPNSRIAVTLEIPTKYCEQSLEDSLSSLSRSIKLPGFRKGKVPKAVIMQQIGIAQIRAAALEKLIEKTWRDALTQESIEPLSEPELQGGFEKALECFDPKKPLTITLETDIAPSPELKKTKGLKVEIDRVEFEPSKIDELLEQSRKQLATVVPVEKRTKAIQGDIAVVSFKGTYKDDGKDIEGGSADSMDIDLEKGKMIPGFIEGIIGMEVDQEKTLECEFPEDYAEKEAKGRKAQFIVKLKDIKIRELPALDDEFAKQASDKSTMQELRQELEERLKDDNERKNISNRNEAILKALTKELKVDLPKTLIDQEKRVLIEQTARQFAQQGMDVKSMFTPDLIKSLMESSNDEAEANVKTRIALNELVKLENIEVDEITIQNRLKEVNAQLKSEKNIDMKKLRQIVIEELSEEKAINWLVENSTITENSLSPEIKETNKAESKSKKSTTKKISEK